MKASGKKLSEGPSDRLVPSRGTGQSVLVIDSCRLGIVGSFHKALHPFLFGRARAEDDESVESFCKGKLISLSLTCDRLRSSVLAKHEVAFLSGLQCRPPTRGVRVPLPLNCRSLAAI